MGGHSVFARVGFVVSVAVATAAVFAGTARADGPVIAGIKIEDESSSCTSAFAAHGNDGQYYLLTSGHCDAHDGSTWTYGPDNAPLGRVSTQEYEVNDETGTQKKDAALIRLEPSVGTPSGAIYGKYPVRGALSLSQIKKGTPICKVGAVTGETCGTITGTEGDYVVQTSVFSLPGDSGSPGFIKNPDGSATAVGILTSSDEGDDNTTYFILVQPLLTKWGLQIL